MIAALRPGTLLAWLIQQWVSITGRRVSLASSPWLDGPIGTAKIGAGIYHEYARQQGLTVSTGDTAAGLLSDFDQLRSRTFAPERVDREIREFYEHTARFGFEVWSQWHGMLAPFARALVALVSRDMEQFNFPLTPLETSRGMTSAIVRLVEPRTGAAPLAGWHRTSALTGRVVYAGFYTVCTPPKASVPCVKVIFPVPHGATTVLLRPANQADDSLVLHSSHEGFGGSGFYRMHRTRAGGIHVQTFPLTERVHVYRDEQRILRTDHTFAYLGMKFLTLHYKITRRDLAAREEGGDGRG